MQVSDKSNNNSDLDNPTIDGPINAANSESASILIPMRKQKKRVGKFENGLASSKVPSHYCRSSTKNLYVESVFRSEIHVYKAYKEWCSENGIRHVTRTSFQKILKEMNVKIHKPRRTNVIFVLPMILVWVTKMNIKLILKGKLTDER